MKKLIVLFSLFISQFAYGLAPVIYSEAQDAFGEKQGTAYQEKIITDAEYEIICEKAGVKYVGHLDQMGKDLIYFNEPETRSTITLLKSEFNVEMIRKVCESKRTLFGKRLVEKTKLPNENEMRCKIVCKDIGIDFVMIKDNKCFFNESEIKTTIHYPIKDFNERNVSLYINEVKLQEYTKQQLLRQRRIKQRILNEVNSEKEKWKKIAEHFKNVNYKTETIELILGAN